jgi:putative metalloenzyme radical SAM/SPASM domain maturase
VTEDKPRKFNVEVTTRCNLDCGMCVRKVWNEESGDMSLETFKALLPTLPQIEMVNVIGIGEPLLNENIFEMIRLAKQHLPQGGTFGLTTNATTIDQEKAQELVEAGLDDLVVSLDGACAATYNRIRSGANFDDVLKNIDSVNMVKQHLNSATPRLGFEFVAMKDNVDELPDVVDLAAKHGASFIIVSNLLPHTLEMDEQVLYDKNSDKAIALFEEAKAEAKRRNLHMDFETPDVENYANALFGVPPLKDRLRSGRPQRSMVRGYDESMGKKFELLDEIVAKAREEKVLMSLKNLIPRDRAEIARVGKVFEEAARRAEKHGIELDLPPLIPNSERECGFIKDRIAFISWDGYVRPCNNLYHSYMCYVNGREKSITAVTFGNVRERDFMDIWNSREYRSFRRNVDRFDFAPCGDCPHQEGCFALMAPVFRKDCYEYTQPCGDCPWARGILKCM